MKTILLEDLKYPRLLKNIKNAPHELYVEGNIDCANMPCITVVGSRNMSEYGKEMTRKIVKELVDAGVCIVSGLAIGIDAVAHETCLENGGKTIAVLGSGLNKIFPKDNIELFHKIIDSGGCVLSEQMPDEDAKKEYFPARNRIVSGLSIGTLVIEAAGRSGTSITAKFALEQKRKLFCIPNGYGYKNSYGTIKLIKKGASLITEGKEILSELGMINKPDNYEELVEQQRINKIQALEEEQLCQLEEKTKAIYYHIKENGIVNLDIMCKDLNISIQELSTHLTILELKGLVVDRTGGNYCVNEKMYI